jgi:FlaA1/EpsC-like NDP-sugar epimerase
LSLRESVLVWPRPLKRAVAIAMDLALCLFATWGAYTLRTDSLHWPQGSEWWNYFIGPVLAIPIFIRFGLYRAIFRFTGMQALVATTQALACYALLHLVAMQWRLWPVFPVTLGIMQPLLFLILVVGSRAIARFWLNGTSTANHTAETQMLIYGAGNAGVQASNALAYARNIKLVGFVDDDPSKIGNTIHGVPVFAAAQLPDVVQRLGITDIVLAVPEKSRDQRNHIIQGLQHLEVHTRTLPNMGDLASGVVMVNDFKELDIEDLLWRPAVPALHASLAGALQDKVILVSGAGGSIGSELCRQILKGKPRQLLLLDHSEFGLYTLHRELQAWCEKESPTIELTPLLASVVNRRRLDWICATYQPDSVYHAAAYKHVPMVECNPSEGMINNVLGTLNLAQAAAAAGVKHFVLISTDKAVRPTNLMGASKRMAELVVQALAHSTQPGGTCFSMVRFGNVLGSSGSVVPLFRNQIAHGGPLTLTHPEVTRYFMTIPEAAQLVLQAGAMAEGGEVFVLEMGEPVKILQLAKRMVELSGMTVRDAEHPQGDIAIDIIGLRPGEKLFEELLIGDNPSNTNHPRIMKAQEQFMPLGTLLTHIKQLQTAAETEDLQTIKAVLHDCVHGFQENN